MKKIYDKPEFELLSFSLLDALGPSKEPPTGTESPIPSEETEFDPELL